jgi:hypothetical protein
LAPFDHKNEYGEIVLTDYNVKTDEFSHCLLIQDKTKDVKTFFYVFPSVNEYSNHNLTNFFCITHSDKDNSLSYKYVEEILEGKIYRRFSKVTIKEFNFSNKIIKSEVHSSNNYLATLLVSNEMIIINLENYDVCGVIEFAEKVKYFNIDKTGLYMCVYKDLDIQNDLCLYEFGTGKKSYTLENIGNISNFCLSEHGLFGFYENGSFYCSNLTLDIKENLERISDELRNDNFFWKHFPIHFNEKSRLN